MFAQRTKGHLIWVMLVCKHALTQQTILCFYPHTSICTMIKYTHFLVALTAQPHHSPFVSSEPIQNTQSYEEPDIWMIWPLKINWMKQISVCSMESLEKSNQIWIFGFYYPSESRMRADGSTLFSVCLPRSCKGFTQVIASINIVDSETPYCCHFEGADVVMF